MPPASEVPPGLLAAALALLAALLFERHVRGRCRDPFTSRMLPSALVDAVGAVARRRRDGGSAGSGGGGGPKVGLFVHTWHDVNPAAARKVMQGGGKYDGGWYWWGRPAWAGGDLAQYTWKNQAMVDYHIDNWNALGVDFVFLDFTNGNQPAILEGAHSLCRRLQQRGGPRVAFWIQKAQYAADYKRQFYDAYPGVMFHWKGKPLLLLQGVDDGWKPAAGKTKPPPAVPGFTARWCWGLLGAASGTMWTFKEAAPPKPYLHAGGPEQIGMTFATQGTYMTTPEGRKCRDGGKFFESQVRNVKKHRPEIVTISGYNEWMAINLAAPAAPPVFTDLWGADCSHDIEPMQGGHGDAYFRQARKFIASLRRQRRWWRD